MPKRIEKAYNTKKMRRIGYLFQKKRLDVLKGSRDAFIADRSNLLFNGDDWISSRYLNNIENGYNLPSIEMLIKLSIALETDTVELFDSIYKILSEKD